MVELTSTQIKLGTAMPDFILRDADGESYHSQNLYGEKGLLVIFTCNHCPYAKAVWSRIIDIAEKATQLGVNTVAINPNINPNYPEDSPEEMKKFIQKNDLKFPYLQDSSQETAKAFRAQCTPDIYLMDRDKNLFYHGRIDDNWQEPEKVKKHELLGAINNLVNGFPSQEKQEPSVGCSIKWRDDEDISDDINL